MGLISGLISIGYVKKAIDLLDEFTDIRCEASKMITFKPLQLTSTKIISQRRPFRAIAGLAIDTEKEYINLFDDPENKEAYMRALYDRIKEPYENLFQNQKLKKRKLFS